MQSNTHSDLGMGWIGMGEDNGICSTIVDSLVGKLRMISLICPSPQVPKVEGN